ncbi:hypothetical protein VE00_08596 [Pseudogymnoascus sp. WSF 3629]|nr:hypothetical protein VE00_08596 [Pseudogymnoascus sp. WSF 3629]
MGSFESKLPTVDNASTATTNGDDTSYKVLEQPYGTARQIRIVTIGAGASGLNLIKTLRTHMTNYDHVVYEKNPEIGGTWYENRYPGCQCDHPSHNYQFSWRPNPNWTKFSADSTEIQEYLCRLCDEEGMRPEIKLSHEIIRAEWNEDLGEWLLKIKNTITEEVFNDHCNFLLNASGILNNWKWPAITGLHDFKGELVHSASWPENFDYNNKKVVVIGNGSSGVQIVPKIQPHVKELVHVIRSPTWIAPPQTERLLKGNSAEIIQSIKMDGDKFTTEQKDRFKADNDYYRGFIKAVEEQVNARFKAQVDVKTLGEASRKIMTAHMTKALGGNQELMEAIIPKFPVGCRRLTPGVGYLESLGKENVRVVTQGIAKITAKGLELTSGEVVEVDAIICATGFDVSFCPRFPIIGRKGNLQDTWRNGIPSAYMSCAVPNVPNYFVFLGPSAPIGHGSVLTISEHVAKYIVSMLKKCQTEGIKAVQPKEDAVRDFIEHIQAFMPRTSWSGNCRSWYKNGTADGPIIALHPGSRIHWFHMLENFRGEDYEYTLDSNNRFRFLGNGFSVKEAEENPTWYLDTPNKLF